MPSLNGQGSKKGRTMGPAFNKLESVCCLAFDHQFFEFDCHRFGVCDDDCLADGELA